jgi:putative Ca2+/H+ antiporter (TMEM165/GDT1 family)
MVAAGALFLAVRTYALWRQMDGSRRSVLIARAASVMIGIMAIASLSDYPLRTPTMMAVLALCVLWLAEPGRRSSADQALAGRGS